MKKTEEAAALVLSLLPPDIKKDIESICASRKAGLSSLREIRIRRGGRASILLGREKTGLRSSVSARDADELLRRLTGGALYAFRDDIASGFIPIGRGIRVGVSGTAEYEGGKLSGISEISSFVFRIPGGVCAFADELYGVWRQGVCSGMLIYSPPGVGKTTALRALAERLGGGFSPLSVVVVDSRREFSAEDFKSFDVDILSGYSKRQGLDIAVRTMSPDVLMIDEVGADDTAAIIGTLCFGVPLVATAHGGSFSEIKRKPALKDILASGAFDVFVGISESASGYALTVDRL